MALKNKIVETAEGNITVRELSFFDFMQLAHDGKEKSVVSQVEKSLSPEDLEKAKRITIEEGLKILEAFNEINGRKEMQINSAEDIEKKKDSIQSGT